MIENMLYLFITISFASAIALIESSYLVEEILRIYKQLLLNAL